MEASTSDLEGELCKYLEACIMHDCVYDRIAPWSEEKNWSEEIQGYATMQRHKAPTKHHTSQLLPFTANKTVVLPSQAATGDPRPSITGTSG